MARGKPARGVGPISVFGDTSFFFAALVPEDANHERALHYLSLWWTPPHEY
jgi:hypothetical protein